MDTAVRLRNDGYLVRMIAAIRFKNATIARRGMRLPRAGKDRKVDKLAKGFVGLLDPVSHGAVEQRALKAKPGVYVLACLMSTQDHREHTRLGLVRLIHITRH
jgi:hypothetical protein